MATAVVFERRDHLSREQALTKARLYAIRLVDSKPVKFPVNLSKHSPPDPHLKFNFIGFKVKRRPVAHTLSIKQVLENPELAKPMSNSIVIVGDGIEDLKPAGKNGEIVSGAFVHVWAIKQLLEYEADHP